LCYVAVDKPVVQILDLHFNDCEKFRAEYSPAANDLLQASGAAGGIVSTSRVTKVKGMWMPDYIVMNFWSSFDEFEAAYTSG